MCEKYQIETQKQYEKKRTRTELNDTGVSDHDISLEQVDLIVVPDHNNKREQDVFDIASILYRRAIISPDGRTYLDVTCEEDYNKEYRKDKFCTFANTRDF